MERNQQLETIRNERTLVERTRELVAPLTTAFQQLSARQRQIAYALFAVAGIAVVAILLLASRTDWKTLFAGLDPQDAREISAQLTAAGIPFEVSPDGTTLRVAAEFIDKARLQTTVKGGPKSGRMGFELFDKPNWVGSEFDEKVNYQRALEGELEHTINTLGAVQSSRVHLVLPHDSLFSDQQRAAKASVVLKLKRRSLSNDEAESVRNLVASAVDDLRADSVVLVDADGRLPLAPKGVDALSEAHELALTQKLIDTIEPVAGVGNVRASVNVEYDRTSSDEVDETYDPTSSATLSMQRTEQSAGGQAAPSGIPGTASNAPNVQPPLYPQQSSNPQSMRQESGTYGVSKKVRHSIDGGGKIRRITAAVLINDRPLSTSERKSIIEWQPRTADEMRHIAGLAQASIGFDSQRGDLVTVENISFEENGRATSTSAMEKMWNLSGKSVPLAKYGAMVLMFLSLIFLVMRPLTKTLATTTVAKTLPASTAQKVITEGQNGEEVHRVHLEKQKVHAQTVHEQISEQLKREPAMASRLLQGWIHSE
jgi:flagellar M-ring protein FliF